ncbi:MAG TPA: TIGR03936 family radical SAM-associated protein [Frankiaceae bacterium]|nr:TIGR03936 family radical SAM-associated protein [Frankiaceae bacterium]
MARSAPDLTGRPTEIAQRLRIRYAKRGRLRFTSHRDIARAFERALRRAAVPMAYSSGFTAHPRVSWVGAAPTGVASEAEYLEIALAEVRDPEQVRKSLDTALPPGLDVLDCVPAEGASLAERIDAGAWQIRLDGVGQAEAERVVAAFLAAPTAPIEKLTKGGKRTVDVRAAVASMAVEDLENTDKNVSSGGADHVCAILTLVVQQTTPAVRPDDVMAAFRMVAGLEPPVPPEVTRLGQGRLAEDGSIFDPLAPVQESARPVG